MLDKGQGLSWGRWCLATPSRYQPNDHPLQDINTVIGVDQLEE